MSGTSLLILTLKKYCTIAVLFYVFSAAMVLGEVSLSYRIDSPLLRFAAEKLDEELCRVTGHVTHYDIHSVPKQIDIVIVSNENDAEILRDKGIPVILSASVQKEGFSISRLKNGSTVSICISAQDDTGAMYGALDLAEQIRLRGNIDKIEEKLSNPRFPFRAIKFNLPWYEYRRGPATEFHADTCRDLNYWRSFLDMMAENRFNVLSLWNMHPFTFMIRPENFPDACPFSDEEMEEWRDFWRSLFRMAKERGIETYIVNWNIVVSPEFAAAYNSRVRNDTSELVRTYTRECVTQVINEYEDLTGIGVTLADWMNNMTPKEREDWIEETVVAGIKNADRSAKFIHRSVLAGSPDEMKRVIDNADLPDPVWVEVKFNWSHGHSTSKLALTHDYTTGEIDNRFWDPFPENYRIVWMIRNEDFFILRWGESDFIREHISVNGKDYVGGYFVGSEGYIPALDYSHQLHKHKTWQYAFEKQWLFYMVWGRLLYDPQISDEIFSSAFERRYGAGIGVPMLKAYKLASRMPNRLASFHAATWDYTLYSEGFLAPVGTDRGFNDRVSAFISIDELIHHVTLDPTYLSIRDYVQKNLEGEKIPATMTSPLQLADELERNAAEIYSILETLRQKVTDFSGAYQCELDDLEAWAHLSNYFAVKLRAGVSLDSFRRTGAADEKEQAVQLLETAAEHWNNLTAVTEKHYRETPHVSGEQFLWGNYTSDVERDIEIARQAEHSVFPR